MRGFPTYYKITLAIKYVKSDKLASLFDKFHIYVGKYKGLWVSLVCSSFLVFCIY